MGSGGTVELGKIAERDGDLGAVRAECSFADRERAFQQGFRLGVPADVQVGDAERAGQIAQGGVIRLIQLLADGEGTLDVRTCLLPIAHVVVEYSEIVEAADGGSVLGSQSLLANS